MSTSAAVKQEQADALEDAHLKVVRAVQQLEWLKAQGGGVVQRMGPGQWVRTTETDAEAAE